MLNLRSEQNHLLKPGENSRGGSRIRSSMVSYPPNQWADSTAKPRALSGLSDP